MKSSNQIINQLQPSTIMAQGGRFQQKYFASNQGLVFIGSYLVDEVVFIQYRQTQSKRPIWSYSSVYYDAVGSGQVMVEGNLTLNYIDSAYLYYALYHTLIRQQRGPSTSRDGYRDALQAISQIDTRTRHVAGLLGKITQQSALDKNGGQLSSPEVRQLAQLIATDPEKGREIISHLKRKFWGNLATNADATNKEAYGHNLSVRDFASQSPLSLDGLANPNAGRAIYARPDQVPPVNIMISHGNPLDPNFSTGRVLREVEFNGNSMRVDPSGQPQMETYSFFCKTVEF